MEGWDGMGCNEAPAACCQGVLYRSLQLPLDPAASSTADGFQQDLRLLPGGWCSGQANNRVFRGSGREGGEIKWECSLKGMNKSCGEWLKYSRKSFMETRPCSWVCC